LQKETDSKSQEGKKVEDDYASTDFTRASDCCVVHEPREASSVNEDRFQAFRFGNGGLSLVIRQKQITFQAHRTSHMQKINRPRPYSFCVFGRKRPGSRERADHINLDFDHRMAAQQLLQSPEGGISTATDLRTFTRGKA
jgi:hypothetical protein